MAHRHEPPSLPVVITGGPGSGKSTVITALADLGFATMPESGRAVIREQRERGGSAVPWGDRTAYAEAMLDEDLRHHRLAEQLDAPVFCDRGVVDIAGYLRVEGLAAPGRLAGMVETIRYHSTVLVAPPWREIYETDEDRRQSWDLAVRTHDAMVSVYTEAGYRLRELPLASVEARVRFVLDAVGLGQARLDVHSPVGPPLSS